MKDFAGYLYGATYHDTQTWLSDLKDEVMEGYFERFMYENIPPARIQEIQDKKLIQFFKLTQPIQCLKADSSTDEFLVTGTVTTQTDLHYQGEVFSTQPVSFVVGLHPESRSPLVYKVGKATNH